MRAKMENIVQHIMPMAVSLVAIAIFAWSGAARAQTPSPTPTRGTCPPPTPERLFVDPVTSPTDDFMQTIQVQGGNFERIEVIAESGTFVAERCFPTWYNFCATVTLLPNATHHIEVIAHVPTTSGGGCTYEGYSLRTTTDFRGAPLTIVQGTNHGPTVSVDPPSWSALPCGDGAFTITIGNPGPTDDVLEISFLRFHHAYSQGDYGTAFTWNTSEITLPLSLARGECVTIPISYSSAGQRFDSRLVLQIVSNARNNRSTQYLAYQARLCPSATPSGPDPTATPTPTLTLMPCYGDCNGDAQVAINELLAGVNIALGATDVSTCEEMDEDGDGEVVINELIMAVNRALIGCG